MVSKLGIECQAAGTGESQRWYSNQWKACKHGQKGLASNMVAYLSNTVAYPTSSVTGGWAYSPYELMVTASSNQTLTVNWTEGLTGGLGQQLGYVYPSYANYKNICTPDEMPQTPEQIAARAKRLAERDAQLKAAKLRAENLLFTILSPTQVKQYSDDGYFEAEVNGRIYRLYANSRSRNVALVEAGREKFKFCAHPSDAHDVPIADVLVSQLLMLKSNEQEFLRVANRSTP